MTATPTTLTHEQICGLIGTTISPDTLPEFLGELGNLYAYASAAIFHDTISGPGVAAIDASVIELEEITDRDQG